MGKFADDLHREMETRVRKAVNDLAYACAEDVREAVSIEVEYVRGPRGGKRVIRSKPGEAPRKEKGSYINSITSQMNEGEPISASAYTTSRIGVYLEDGTEKMAPRPHWGPAFRRWSERAAKFIFRQLSN
jgi:hypothetical protein